MIRASALKTTKIFRNGGGGGARLMVQKPASRAAVHGAKPPEVNIVDKEKVQMNVEKDEQEKERLRKEIEERVDSNLKKTNLEVLTVSDQTK